MIVPAFLLSLLDSYLVSLPDLIDPEKSEYFVKVKWLESVPVEKAFHQVGFFGNQNSACKPTTPKWRHTVEHLKERFTKWDKISSG